jgi:Spy/CpxP family protein refolding chaperone
VKLEDLTTSLESKTPEEILDLIRGIRNDRKVSKRAEKPLTKEKKAKEKSNVLEKLFNSLTPDQRAKLLEQMQKGS